MGERPRQQRDLLQEDLPAEVTGLNYSDGAIMQDITQVHETAKKDEQSRNTNEISSSCNINFQEGIMNDSNVALRGAGNQGQTNERAFQGMAPNQSMRAYLQNPINQS